MKTEIELKTAEQIVQQMVDIMPFSLKYPIIPYILEAMEVYASQYKDRPTPPVEVKTAEEILAKQQRSSFGNYTWERVIEAMEAYHAQFTPSAKSVEVEESAKEASKRYVDTMNLRYHRVMPAGADLIFQDGANWQQQKQAETIGQLTESLKTIYSLAKPGSAIYDICDKTLNPKK